MRGCALAAAAFLFAACVGDIDEDPPADAAVGLDATDLPGSDSAPPPPDALAHPDAGFDRQICADILSSLLSPITPTPFPSEGRAPVFVYGTLLSGEPNHGYMASADFVGEALTVPCFLLYDLGSYPGMVPDGETRVVGEVYEVTEATRNSLDNLEGHPDFYRRIPIPVEVDGSLTIAETYLLRPSQVVGDPVIESGDWRNP